MIKFASATQRDASAYAQGQQRFTPHTSRTVVAIAPPSLCAGFLDRHLPAPQPTRSGGTVNLSRHYCCRAGTSSYVLHEVVVVVQRLIKFVVIQARCAASVADVDVLLLPSCEHPR